MPQMLEGHRTGKYEIPVNLIFLGKSGKNDLAQEIVCYAFFSSQEVIGTQIVSRYAGERQQPLPAGLVHTDCVRIPASVEIALGHMFNGC